jgi:hypothetical protein
MSKWRAEKTSRLASSTVQSDDGFRFRPMAVRKYDLPDDGDLVFKTNLLMPCGHFMAAPLSQTMFLDNRPLC